ncbi:hypothetical protein Dfri01_68380 [Dyadobacter frigoris]|uniref:hypothetical protein n=1 Tax=Dyadobacter frigoris TaxID=2576211 RepID=UPI0024A2572F|nr:hypothetical protein [Dyadobacter frigoris]GLU57377.1 hypothetical protein Dfri01_68380 [Dyadobacter frigoris]
MIRKSIKARVLPPDPNRSLFKFKLSWLDPSQPGQIKIQTWYSYDYDSERQVFPCGLDKELRSEWKQLLALCYKHTELYDFVKWLRPYKKEQRLDLYLPNWPELSAMIPLVENKYGWQLLEAYGHSCGFESLSFQTVSRSYPRQPGHSPGRVDFRQFYGYGYFQRNNFIVSSLASGRLIKVDIYDNLMYHSDNFLHSLGSIQPENR